MTRRNNAIPTRLYYVETLTMHDHPENRGPSYPVVKAGSTFISKRYKLTAGEAIREFEEALAGEMDCSATLVVWAEVYSTDLDGNRPRMIRNRVRRQRNADGTVSREDSASA